MRAPALQPQTEANVSKLRSVPSTRKRLGECGSVRTPAWRWRAKEDKRAVSYEAGLATIEGGC